MNELYFDGACEPNPGTGSIGIVLMEGGEAVATGSTLLNGKVTSNVAEYAALWFGLRAVLERGWEHIHIYGDSTLVVHQVNGKWKARTPHIIANRNKVLWLLESFQSWTLEWKGREFNSPADKLSKDVLIANGITPRY